MIVKLKNNLFDYLNQSLNEKQEKLKIIFINAIKKDHFVILEIDEEIADEIRDWACEELQKKGFEISYNLNPEGKILEELIDLFCVK